MSSKWDQMMKSVSDRQIALARKFQAAGITSFSQAIKAFANRDNARIEGWKRELTAKSEAKVAPAVQDQPSPIVAYLRSVKWTR